MSSLRLGTNRSNLSLVRDRQAGEVHLRLSGLCSRLESWGRTYPLPASYPVRNVGGKSDTSLRALHHPSPSRRGLNERRRLSHRNDSSPRGRERLNRDRDGSPM